MPDFDGGGGWCEGLAGLKEDVFCTDFNMFGEYTTSRFWLVYYRLVATSDSWHTRGWMNKHKRVNFRGKQGDDVNNTNYCR